MCVPSEKKKFHEITPNMRVENSSTMKMRSGKVDSMKAYLNNKLLQYDSINAQLFSIYAITDPHSSNKIREWTTKGLSKHQGSA